MGRPTCGTCPYWDGGAVVDLGDLEVEEGHEGLTYQIGVCFRMPPVFIGPWPKRLGDYEDANADAWGHPFTARTDACGEHPDFPAYIACPKDPR